MYVGAWSPVLGGFSDTSFGLVDYRLVVYKGMIRVMGLTVVSARGGGYFPRVGAGLGMLPR